MNRSSFPTGDSPVPFHLRANDVQKHILSIDSRFRDDPTNTGASNFYYRFLSPFKNILQLRITSVEFPAGYYFFTQKRNNTTIRILYKETADAPSNSVIVTIRDGNYTAHEMENELNEQFQETGSELSWLSVVYDTITEHFTFTGSKMFAIDTTYNAYDRPFDYGLAYYLGFSCKIHKGNQYDDSYILESNQIANFSGDSYLFLKINDYNCVNHSMLTDELTATAKIVFHKQQNAIVYDDYASQHAKEVVFPAPQDLSRLRIQVMDAYGQLIDMSGRNMSFSIEVLEVKNLNLYNIIRDSLAVKYSGVVPGFSA